MTQNITLGLSFLTVAGQVLILTALFFLIKGKTPDIFKKNALLFSFSVALLSVLGSLYYSEIAKYEPCVLCWYQRIFMYSEVFILGLALIKKEGKKIADYIITLSLIGACFAAFNYYLQVSRNNSFACSTVGYSVSCSETFFLNFGYITMPMMALTAFLIIASFMWILRKEAA